MFVQAAWDVTKKNYHVRFGKEIRISIAYIFQARYRDNAEEAAAGNIICIFDIGKYQIGDTYSIGKKAHSLYGNSELSSVIIYASYWQKSNAGQAP